VNIKNLQNLKYKLYPETKPNPRYKFTGGILNCINYDQFKKKTGLSNKMASSIWMTFKLNQHKK